MTVIDALEHLSARSGMTLPATLAGAAFSSCGVSLAHALEYLIGLTYKCSHCLGNTIVLPAVMQLWLLKRFDRFALIVWLLSVVDTKHVSEAETHVGIKRIVVAFVRSWWQTRRHSCTCRSNVGVALTSRLVTAPPHGE